MVLSETLADVVRLAKNAARAAILFPLYFFLLTLFIAWPWRWGHPMWLLWPLRGLREARFAEELRWMIPRIWVHRAGGNVRSQDWKTSGSILRWIKFPFKQMPICLELCRNHRGGAPSTIKRWSRFMEALPDSLRFANGAASYNWFDSARRPRASLNVPVIWHYVLCGAINPIKCSSIAIGQRHISKLEFFSRFHDSSLPVIPVFTSFQGGQVIEHCNLEPGPLLGKPDLEGGSRGEFARWFPCDGDGSLYRNDEKETCTIEEITGRLIQLSTTDRYILQPLVENHAMIRRISGVDTLCTVRIPTVCFRDGTSQPLPMAVLKMPVVNIAADNMIRGAIGYSVDIETGQLGPGGRMVVDERVYRRHPSSGEEVVGCKLPFWQESVQLCLRAHSELFPEIPSVGWDLAITDDGPILLEMNVTWYSERRIPGEVFLGETAYPECLLEHVSDLWAVPFSRPS